MDMEMKVGFERLWQRYFGQAELPLACFYAREQPQGTQMPKPPTGHRCVIADLSKARAGKSLALVADVVGCAGGKKYLGFAKGLMPQFEYFLSYGIPGKLEGERYKKTPDLVKEVMERQPSFTAPAPFICFKRWDRLEEGDEPAVIVFFARPDVLSGLFTLSNYDRTDPDGGAYCPFGAGCSTIVQYPFMETEKKEPRAVIGMLDVSARPCVAAEAITFALPMKRFAEMVGNMEESFLITGSWTKVKRRIARSEPKE